MLHEFFGLTRYRLRAQHLIPAEVWKQSRGELTDACNNTSVSSLVATAFSDGVTAAMIRAAALALLLAATPAAAQELRPEALPLDPHVSLGLSLATPDGALAEVVGYLEAKDDLRLAHALAPGAHVVAANAFRMARYDAVLPPEGAVRGAARGLYALYLGDAAVPGGSPPRAGDPGREFSVLMSMARHFGGPPVDLRGAVAAGPPEISIGAAGLAEARIPVTGPHLAGPTVVHFEGAPSGRWRLLGAEMAAPEGRRVWLLAE